MNITGFVFNEGTPRVLAVAGRVTASGANLPAAPTVLGAVAISSGTIDLSWIDNASNETGYNVQRTVDTTSSWSTVRSLPANTTMDSDSGLTDGTKYFYRVYASNSGGNSGYSNVSSAITPMRAPTNLTALQLSGESVTLTWKDNSGSELVYYIERKLGPSGTYAVIDSVGSNKVSYVDATGVPGNQYFYRVRGHNLLVTSAYSNEANLVITGIKSGRSGIPDKFDLSQNFPNPFNPSTDILYQAPVGGHVTLKIFDSLGREIATLVDADLPAGYYDVTFNAESLPSGIYFYRIMASNFTSVRKMVLMK